MDRPACCGGNLLPARVCRSVYGKAAQTSLEQEFLDEVEQECDEVCAAGEEVRNYLTLPLMQRERWKAVHRDLSDDVTQSTILECMCRVSLKCWPPLLVRSYYAAHALLNS